MRYPGQELLACLPKKILPCVDRFNTSSQIFLEPPSSHTTLSTPHTFPSFLSHAVEVLQIWYKEQMLGLGQLNPSNSSSRRGGEKDTAQMIRGEQE